ncbi:MAG: DUF2905 domain-containing protein [Chthoniobacterales bacterium]
MNEAGKFLVYVGAAIAIVGGLIWLGFGSWIGKLPGDLAFHKGSFGFYFPITTCLLISIVLTLVLWLFRR